MNRGEELILKALDQDLTQAESDELAAILAGDDAEAEDAFELLELESMLRARVPHDDLSRDVVGKLKKSVSDETARVVLDKIKGRDVSRKMKATTKSTKRFVNRMGDSRKGWSKQKKTKSSARGLIWLGLAASVCIISGIGAHLVLNRQQVKNAVGHVISVNGSLETMRNGEWISLTVGDEFAADVQIRTSGTANARIALSDHSAFELAPDTVLSFKRGVEGMVLKLEGGEVLSRVAKQRVGHRFKVVTPKLNITVIGTVFRTTARGEDSSVKVDEGLVKTVFGPSRESIELGANDELKLSGDIVVTRPSGTYWKIDFEGSPVAPWSGTNRVSMKQCTVGNGSGFCAKAVKIKSKPDCRSADSDYLSKGMFTYTDDLVLSFDYLIAGNKCRWVGVWARVKGYDESFYVAVDIKKQNKWGHIELPIRELISRPVKRMRLKKGDLIHQVRLMGDGEVDDDLYFDNITLTRGK